MMNPKNWLRKNQKDVLIYTLIVVFITVMHGINQSRIHRDSAAMYWKHLQPQLMQRYVALSRQAEILKELPKLEDARHTLTYQAYPETKAWAQDLESKLQQYIDATPGALIAANSDLIIELNRYNETVSYIHKKEKGWLYKITMRIVKRSPLSSFKLAK